jgi:anti-anti-sigma regulatory factor
MQIISLVEVFKNGKIQFREDVFSLRSIIQDNDVIFDLQGIDFLSFSAGDEFLKLVQELSASGAIRIINYSSSIKKVLDGQVIARQYPPECALLMH